MSASLSMSFSDMETEISRLKLCVENFDAITQSMTASVNTLCDGWTSDASNAYREDYTTVAASFAQTTAVVSDLITSIERYVGDMQSLDQAYSVTKVSREK